MSSEPDALVLADALDPSISAYPPHYTDVDAAAAELRRLHAENATLTDSCAAKADRIDRLGEAVERMTAEREVDRAVMREALEALQFSLNFVGRPDRRIDAAIEKLKARTS